MFKWIPHRNKQAQVLHERPKKIIMNVFTRFLMKRVQEKRTLSFKSAVGKLTAYHDSIQIYSAIVWFSSWFSWSGETTLHYTMCKYAWKTRYKHIYYAYTYLLRSPVVACLPCCHRQLVSKWHIFQMLSAFEYKFHLKWICMKRNSKRD